MNPNYPRPKHVRYLNAQQFRVREMIGMSTPSSKIKVPRVTSSKIVTPYTHHKR
jgi:hypothetical protein